MAKKRARPRRVPAGHPQETAPAACPSTKKTATNKLQQSGLQQYLELTGPQLRVLQFLQDWFAEQPWPPTYREICAELAYLYPNSAYQIVQLLIRKGLVVRGNAYRSRSIALTPFGKSYPNLPPRKAGQTSRAPRVPVAAGGRVARKA